MECEDCDGGERNGVSLYTGSGAGGLVISFVAGDATPGPKAEAEPDAYAATDHKPLALTLTLILTLPLTPNLALALTMHGRSWQPQKLVCALAPCGYLVNRYNSSNGRSWQPPLQ